MNLFGELSVSLRSSEVIIGRHSGTHLWAGWGCRSCLPLDNSRWLDFHRDEDQHARYAYLGIGPLFLSVQRVKRRATQHDPPTRNQPCTSNPSSPKPERNVIMDNVRAALSNAIAQVGSFLSDDPDGLFTDKTIWWQLLRLQDELEYTRHVLDAPPGYELPKKTAIMDAIYRTRERVADATAS